jgi:hypothetical protein
MGVGTFSVPKSGMRVCITWLWQLEFYVEVGEEVSAKQMMMRRI